MTDSCCSPARPPGPSATSGPVPVDGATRRGSVWKDLVALDGGDFLMGTEDAEGFPADGEGPVRKVSLPAFAISRHAVSNARFQEFVDNTGYTTEGERIGWCFVFHLLVSKFARKREMVRKVPGLGWWLAVDGANWRHPEGKGSSIRDRMDHPVVHISWNDAQAFCGWAALRLPTEAEWEYAARGGLVGKRYVWGDELTPGGMHMCNIWQGTFPTQNSAEDGWVSTCPVGTYQPNGFGLFNMAGNVWEWCSDPWSPAPHLHPPHINPAGPATNRAMRGGSYLCHRSYCNRYRVAARSSNAPDSATGNLGFRCAANHTASPGS